MTIPTDAELLHNTSRVVSSGKAYIPALVESLRVDTVLNFDLYVNESDGSGYVLYRKRNLPFTEENAQHLRQRDEGRFYIATTDRTRYLQYLEQNLTIILKDKNISVEKKSTMLYHSAANTVSQIFNSPGSTENIRRTSGMVSNISGHVIGNPRAFQGLLKLASHDYHTYTHSINVCTYSLMIGDSMNEFSPGELKELGMGAILHDIGKSRISDDIIRKRGPLSAVEWLEMKKHPQYGVKLLADYENFSANSMSVVADHHEKLDGSGYPKGLKAGEIGLMARIVCVADIFDALTTCRPYKGAISSFDALMLMHREMADHIDLHVFEHLILLLKVT